MPHPGHCYRVLQRKMITPQRKPGPALALVDLRPGIFIVETI